MEFPLSPESRFIPGREEFCQKRTANGEGELHFELLKMRIKRERGSVLKKMVAMFLSDSSSEFRDKLRSLDH